MSDNKNFTLDKKNFIEQELAKNIIAIEKIFVVRIVLKNVDISIILIMVALLLLIKQ